MHAFVDDHQVARIDMGFYHAVAGNFYHDGTLRTRYHIGIQVYIMGIFFVSWRWESCLHRVIDLLSEKSLLWNESMFVFDEIPLLDEPLEKIRHTPLRFESQKLFDLIEIRQMLMLTEILAENGEML